MNAKTAVVSILILQLLGCVTTTGMECTPPVPPSDKAAELIVYRPTRLFGWLVDAPISIDDCIVGRLGSGAFIRYKVAAGTHKVRSEKLLGATGGDAEISTEFALGETVYIRYVLWRVGEFAVTEKISAEREMRALRGLGPLKD